MVFTNRPLTISAQIIEISGNDTCFLLHTDGNALALCRTKLGKTFQFKSLLLMLTSPLLTELIRNSFGNM